MTKVGSSHLFKTKENPPQGWLSNCFRGFSSTCWKLCTTPSSHFVKHVTISGWEPSNEARLKIAAYTSKEGMQVQPNCTCICSTGWLQ